MQFVCFLMEGSYWQGPSLKNIAYWGTLSLSHGLFLTYVFIFFKKYIINIILTGGRPLDSPPCKSQSSWNLFLLFLSTIFTKDGTMGFLSCQLQNHLRFDRSAHVNGFLRTGPHYPLLYNCMVKTGFLFKYFSLFVW